jgi:hypothetical protein
VARGPGDIDITTLDLDALVDLVFAQLGWRAPEEAAFTIGRALDEAAAAAGRLALAATEAEVRGFATTGLDRIEQVLRFSVACWATQLRGDKWEGCLDDLVGRHQKLFFGEWRRAFQELPTRYAAESRVLGGVSARLRRAKLWPALDKAVAVRNTLGHRAEPGSWASLRDEALAAIDESVTKLRLADESGALPQVLQPVHEVRDPLGRITLTVVGHGNRYAEFLMTEPTDLAVPLVLLPGDTNPREIDPTVVPAGVAMRRAQLLA